MFWPLGVFPLRLLRYFRLTSPPCRFVRHRRLLGGCSLKDRLGYLLLYSRLWNLAVVSESRKVHKGTVLLRDQIVETSSVLDAAAPSTDCFTICIVSHPNLFDMA